MRDDKTLARDLLEALILAVIFATFARTFVLQVFKIPSASMEKNLLVGDHVLVNKFIYGPAMTAVERRLLPLRDVRRGDVAVFKYPLDPTRDFIKRCLGLPGDEVRMENKVLFVNGERIDDSGYVVHRDPEVYPSSRFLTEAHRYRDNFGPLAVEPERYLCLGDNRDNSSDSRSWGQVPRDHFKGRALMVLWSFVAPEDSPPVASAGRWSRLTRLSRSLLRPFRDTRWERTFQIVR